jgi:glutamate dehydrogenase
MAHALVTKAKKFIPAKSPSGLTSFLSGFYKNVPDEDIADIDANMLAETVRRHWDLTIHRTKGKPAVEIYTVQPEKGQGLVGSTIINTVYEDMSFIVDSVTAELTRRHKQIEVLVHPVLHVEFEKSKAISAVRDQPGESTLTQSHMHIRLHGVLAEDEQKELHDSLVQILIDVYYATRDWQAMRERMIECKEGLMNVPSKVCSAERRDEYIDFLNYIYSDNFTLLGYREYEFVEKKGEIRSKTVKGRSLGLFHDDVTPVYVSEYKDGLPQDLQSLRRNQPPMTVSKVNRVSTVHRAVPLDAIAIKRFDKKGNVCGEALLIGLFTSVTYSRSINDIPFLRRKAEVVCKNAGFKPGTHDDKALRHILEKYPRDELFQIKIDLLTKTALSILRLKERLRIALYIRPDAFGRYISCLVYIPRDRYDTRLRKQFARILEDSLEGTCTNFHTNLDDSPLARVLYTIEISQKQPPKYNRAQIEAKLQEAGRLWGEKLANALKQANEHQDTIAAIVRDYGEAFPVAYQDAYTLKQAIHDIKKLEEAHECGRFALDLYKCNRCAGGQLRLKIYQVGRPVILSDILPVLENMGMRVLEELPSEVRPAHSDQSVWVHDFMMEAVDESASENIDKFKDNFEEALLRIWYEQTEDDGLNRLILTGELTWRDILILRCYLRYVRQIGYAFGSRYIEKTLCKHSEIATDIAELFKIMFDPTLNGTRNKKAAKLNEKLAAELDQVTSLDEDRILRSMLSLVNATLRTNYFQTTEDGHPKDYLSIKLDSTRIMDLPLPRPFCEIFVYSARVEGVHLRGDYIARGGLRWSDRQADFRTEILDLMKAQQVKNSVIVPMGAKGGFVLKKAPTTGGRDAYLAEGIECYKTFVRGLLDITDNRVGTDIVPPKDVVRRDTNDPYLVVAADKGTATFSDIANGLAAEYGFWLGDAFASGGSAGYDHKGMGITARGAWESVKRHFLEQGLDIQSKEFDVIGVGDMGGDVFGNGMLLSRKIRLVGAFNHMHIFCDPEPNAATSFKERERLFKQVKGWGDYDAKKLSTGGRIFLRSEKTLKLTPQIKKAFGLTKDQVSPNELIKAMLRHDADLLWFGGIGTYVKSSAESHADAGDKANDNLRINATEIRAAVVGEGANLGVTQKARIEYARNGGKINADFIDNAGGVDCSDHEVNIKILLADVMANSKKSLSEKQRNKFLEEMTDEVGNLVLRNNYQQSQGISLMMESAVADLPSHASLMEELETDAGLDRSVENLPDNEEIDNRIKTGQGLARPEMAILQAYTKIQLTRDLMDTNIPDSPHLQEESLVNYFPEPMRKKYRKQIFQHRLHREISSMSIANGVVNRMGPSFVRDMVEQTGASTYDVIRAYLIVREIFDLLPLWREIESLDYKVDAQYQLHLMSEIKRLVVRETRWFLTRLGRQPQIRRDLKIFRGGVAEFRDVITKVLNPEMEETVKRRTHNAVEEGIPKKVAHEVALMPTLSAACDIIRISNQHHVSIEIAAKLYFSLAGRFHIRWLRKQARKIEAEDKWTGAAIDSLIEQLYNCQAGLTSRILGDMKQELADGHKEVLESWLRKHEQYVAKIDPYFNEISKSTHIDVPMLILAEQRLRHLYGG